PQSLVALSARRTHPPPLFPYTTLFLSPAKDAGSGPGNRRRSAPPLRLPKSAVQTAAATPSCPWKIPRSDGRARTSPEPAPRTNKGGQQPRESSTDQGDAPENRPFLTPLFQKVII